MENYSEALKTNDAMVLPPGFRFHPTDEELITHYLSKKVVDSSFCAIAIGEVDMNKVEPWELPWRAKMGEKEFYFFCVRDKKYPTGLRTNRATEAGYWKATGKDKEIFRGKTLVGMKKTLVFYRGRAPKGEKSNWVSHEYRVEGKFSLENLPKAAKNDWVISRVFHKTSGGKKVHISGLMRMNSGENEFSSSTLPPLMDPSPKPEASEPGHVHCFSNTIVDDPHKIHENMIINPMDTFAWGQFPLVRAPFPGQVPLHDPSIIKSFLANYGQNMNHGFEKDKEMASVSQETTENSSVVSNVDMGRKAYEELEDPVGPQDLDCIWSY